MKTFLWVVTVIGSILGMLVLVLGEISANGAPQECAVAAIALGLAVLPYCLARAASELTKKESKGETT